MVEIGERHLSVFIALLARELRAMEAELARLRALAEPTAAGDDERTTLQEMLLQYDLMLDDLRESHAAAVARGVVMMPFERLAGTG